jgi:pyruvate-ferredoxin/flavodoxin oxidoreductase
VLPREQAIEQIKYAIKKTYGKRGEAVVQQNFAAVDSTLENLFEVKVPEMVTSSVAMRAPVAEAAPDFVRNVLGPMIASTATPAGQRHARRWHLPHRHHQWEKRNMALEIPGLGT